MATPRPICPVVVNVVATNITGFGSPNDSRRRVRSRIVFFAATAIGVVLAVLCGAYAVIGSFPAQETPLEAAFNKLPLSSQDLKRMADGETIHVTLSRVNNKNITTIFQVTAEDLQMSREELLRASRMIVSSRRGVSAKGWV